MADGKTVFIVGPGFIGWNVLDLLVAEEYTVSALVRRSDHAKNIQASGATPVTGSLDDAELITKLVIANDIVFHIATADHLPSAEAVLAGIRTRAALGKSTLFIHTSGTGVLDDGAAGAFASDTIYTDEEPSAIDALADDAPHRPIDLAIVTAQRKLGDKAKIAIMIPPLIYGYNAKHARLTIQIPTLTRFALKHGFAGHVGEGRSLESQIHVMDLARAYIVILHYMERSSPSAVLENPYFFCENGKEFSWREVGEEIGKTLHASGRIDSKDARPIPLALYGDLFVSCRWGKNMNVD